MGKLSLATRLADELGVSVQKASRAVDDIGAGRVERVVDDLSAKGSKTISDWLKPATVAGGAVGGGALLWRQQDVAEARALAEQQSTYRETVKEIVESDLPPDLKREALDDAGASTSDGGGSGGDGGLIPDDPQTLIILIIVMALVLNYSLEGGI